MAWALLQVNCAPHAVDKYPMGKTIVVLAWFANEEEARAHWPEDLVHTPDTVYEGQSVYQMLWDVRKPLNIDRATENCNKVSCVGAWLPESVRQPIEDADKIELVCRGSGGSEYHAANEGPQTKAGIRAARMAAVKTKPPKPQPVIARKGRSGPFSAGSKAASAVGRADKPRKPVVSAAQIRADQVSAALAAAAATVGPDVKLVPITLSGAPSGYRPPQVWRTSESR